MGKPSQNTLEFVAALVKQLAAKRIIELEQNHA